MGSSPAGRANPIPAWRPAAAAALDIDAEANVQDRVATFPLGWAAAIFAVAQLADLVTAWRVARELNPLAAVLLSEPLVGLVVKVLLIVFVVAVAELVAGGAPAWPGSSSCSGRWPGSPA